MTKTAKRVMELQADIERWSANLKWQKEHLAKYPHDTYAKESIAGLESVILRASSYIKAVSK
jgi:transposase-like protein